VRDLTLFLSYINVEDSEAVLRGLRLLPPERPIDVLSIHVVALLAAERIAKALAEHSGKVTVFVSRYAMSGGTPIAPLPTRS
jgi:ClpP class serine protease